MALRDVLREVLPSVVGIESGDGLGTGFIVHQSGLVVTNNHILADLDHVHCISYGRRDREKKHKAEVVWLNERVDFCIVHCKGLGLPPLNLGSSKDIETGDDVIAVGNPLGLARTVTRGIVSGFKKLSLDEISTLEYIQHDATINTGNSGGPLITGDGKVVGVNAWSQLADDLADPAINLNFAIPADYLRGALADLTARANVTHYAESYPRIYRVEERVNVNLPDEQLLRQIQDHLQGVSGLDLFNLFYLQAYHFLKPTKPDQDSEIRLVLAHYHKDEYFCAHVSGNRYRDVRLVDRPPWTIEWRH